MLDPEFWLRAISANQAQVLLLRYPLLETLCPSLVLFLFSTHLPASPEQRKCKAHACCKDQEPERTKAPPLDNWSWLAASMRGPCT